MGLGKIQLYLLKKTENGEIVRLVARQVQKNLESNNFGGGNGFCEPNNIEVLFICFCSPHCTKMDKAAVFFDGLRKRNKSEEDEVELMDEDGA